MKEQSELEQRGVASAAMGSIPFKQAPDGVSLKLRDSWGVEAYEEEKKGAGQMP